MEILSVDRVTPGLAPLALDKIPVRNVWLLFLYASELTQFRDRFDVEVEQSPDFKSLIARLLCYATEKTPPAELKLRLPKAGRCVAARPGPH